MVYFVLEELFLRFEFGKGGGSGRISIRPKCLKGPSKLTGDFAGSSCKMVILKILLKD